MARTVLSPPGKPVLLYDAGCPFCRTWVGRLRRVAGGRVACISNRHQPDRFPEIPDDVRERFLVFIGMDGAVALGAEAVFAAMGVIPGLQWFPGLLRRVPFARRVSERVYLFVSRHRRRLPG